jgi:hypothetical protein
MFRKPIIVLLMTALIITSFAFPVYGASGQVNVTIPAFPVTLNELTFDNNDYERYPLLVYRDITYFPMTYYQSNLLNLNTSWTAEGGLVITKGNPDMPKAFSGETPVTNRNSRTQTAAVVDSKVTVNGEAIDNRNEQYPLLLFRDITYFPMTWRFAVDEFGWSYTFDNTAGLSIRADNFFYTPIEVGANTIANDGAYVGGYSETHYIKGDLRIVLITDSNRMGPIGENLYIIKNGAETRPTGYFGYYRGQTPLFTVDGGFINTTYYTTDVPEIRNPQPCKVNIETGQIN